MSYLETLRTLDTVSEKLLRLRAITLGRDAAPTLDPIRQGLEAGRLHGLRVLDGAGVARGLAVWRWQDAARTYAQIVLSYVLPDSPDAFSTALVAGVYEQLAAVHSVQVVEARLRHTDAGVRAAWLNCDFAFFERCRMTRALGRVPLPVVPVPRGYRIRPWDASYDAEVAEVAAAAQAHSIDRAALPAWQPDDMPHLLHTMRAGTYRPDHVWHLDASRVMAHEGEVVGYIAALAYEETATIVHLGVLPRYRRKGLARALLIYSLMGAQSAQLDGAELAVTTRNPARPLVEQLGFQPVECGDVAIWWRDGRQLAWRE